MSVTRETILKLGEPIPKSRVGQRQGPKMHPGDCQKRYGVCSLNHRMLDYITARVAMERLDSVLGPENWQDQYHDRTDGSVRAGVGVNVEGAGWVWKWDVGTESDMEADKGSYSDAFKRACVKWGIARELYPEVAKHAPPAQALARPAAPGREGAAPEPRPTPVPAVEDGYASGRVAKGRAPVDMSLRETPDGWAFGFVIEEEVEGKQYPRKVQVLATQDLAHVIAQVWDNPTHADAWGELVMVPWQKDGKDMPPFRRILATRVMTAEWTLPAPDAPAGVSVAPAGAQGKVENLDDLPF